MILAYICSDFIFIIRKLIALLKINKQRYINLPKSNEDNLNYISTNSKTNDKRTTSDNEPYYCKCRMHWCIYSGKIQSVFLSL